MFLVNTDYIPGKNLQMLGFVYGTKFVMTVISSRNVEQAMQEMVKNARTMGADAIINIRYAPSTNHAFVSGTAVRFV